MTTTLLIYNNQQEVIQHKDPNNANWKQLAKDEKLSEQFIIDNADFLDWNLVSEHQQLTIKTLTDCRDKVKWKKIPANPHLSDDVKKIASYKMLWYKLIDKESATITEDFLRKYKIFLDAYSWKLISKKMTLYKTFIREFRFILDWSTIHKSQKHLSLAFMAEFNTFIAPDYATPSLAFQIVSEDDILANATQMDWLELFRSQTFSETFIRKLIPLAGNNPLFWNFLSLNQKLSENFLTEYEDKIEWNYASSNVHLLSENFLRKFAHKDLNWSHISEHFHFSAKLIDDLQHKLDWERLSCNKTFCLTEDIIRKYEKRWYWDWIWYCQKLSEPFIREFIHKAKWEYIWECQTPVLSEAFFRDYPKINWYKIQYIGFPNKVYGGYDYERFSESFIRTYADKLVWAYISAYSPVSESFIREFQDRINWGMLFKYKYQNLSQSFKDEFVDNIEWDTIDIYDQNGISEDFVREFAHKINWDFAQWLFWEKHKIKCSEEFCREFASKFNKNVWKKISAEQAFSEVFIRDFAKKLDWKVMSQHQKLSEKLIREFEDKVDWRKIFKHQYLSKEFIQEFKRKIV